MPLHAHSNVLGPSTTSGSIQSSGTLYIHSEDCAKVCDVDVRSGKLIHICGMDWIAILT